MVFAGRYSVRPVICAASLAATALGSVFLFSRWPKDTAEVGTQTEWDTTEAGTQAEVDEVNTQARQMTPDAGIQAVLETAHAPGDGTDGIYLSVRLAPQTVRTHSLRDADGGGLLLFGTQHIQDTCRTVGFVFSECFSCGPRWVEVKYTWAETWKESQRTQCWYLTNTFYVDTEEGRREQYASVLFTTSIQRYCGGIVHVSAHLQTQHMGVCLDEAGVLMAETSSTCKGMTIAADGRVSTVDQSHTLKVPAPTFRPPNSDSPSGPSTSEPDAAGPHGASYAPGPHAAGPSDGDGTPCSAQKTGNPSLLPEAEQVPSLYRLFLATGLENFSVRLSGLREAFAVFQEDDFYGNFIATAGKMMLSNVATLNGKDAGAFEQAFHQLLAFAYSPDCRQTMEAELLEVEIYSINLLDVLFEMIFLGELERTRASLVPRVQGGFLDCVLMAIHAFMPSEAWSQEAATCWQMLQVEVVGFLTEIFSLDLSIYGQTQVLADVLYSCLEQHVDQLLGNMPVA